MLIVDPKNPGKFNTVRVDKTKERHALLLAETAKKPAMTLLNGILSCVFRDEELSKSSGLGLRKTSDDMKPALNKLKIEAVRGIYNCITFQFKCIILNEFNQ